jgi:hypothetical protein
MARYASFKQAAVPGTPDYVNAEISRSRIANQASQEKERLQRQMLADGATAYDKFTGENTPIADYTSSLVNSLRGSPSQSGTEQVAMDTPGADPTGGRGLEMKAADPMMGDMDAMMSAPDIEPTGGMLDGLRASGEGMDAASVADAAMMPGAEQVAMNTPGAMAGADAAMAGADSAVDAASAIEGVSAGGLMSALRGADQIAKGDVAGAASTGVQAYLATLGPAGIAAGILMGLVS